MFANEQTHTHWTKSKLHSRCTKHSTRKYATLEFLKQFSVLVDSRLSIPWGSCCWVWAHSIPTYIFCVFVHRENVNAKEKLFLRWKWESFREGGNEESALNQQKSRVGSRRSRLRRRDGGESREDEINGKETKTDESQTSWLSRQSSTNGEISFLILILCWLLWSSVRSVGILNRDQKLCLHKKNSIASHRTKYVWTCSEA